MKRLAVLISGRGSNMLALHDAIQRQEISGKIVRVISDKADALGLTKAGELGLSCAVAKADNPSSRAELEKSLTRVLAKSTPDLIILAGFMRILSKDFAREHPHMINIHPSLLPKYRGLDTHARVLTAGDAQHGATVHYVTAELDAGPILVQKAIAVQTEKDTVASLSERLLPEEHRCLVLAVRLICEDRMVYEPNTRQVHLDGELLPNTGLCYGTKDEIKWPQT